MHRLVNALVSSADLTKLATNSVLIDAISLTGPVQSRRVGGGDTQSLRSVNSNIQLITDNERDDDDLDRKLLSFFFLGAFYFFNPLCYMYSS